MSEDTLPSNEEAWKHKLDDEQYAILRQESTEHPFSSRLLNEHRDGSFHCAGCDTLLFTSAMKFNSNTGWPSFFDAITDHIETKEDHHLGTPRTEYHCATCGGHLGHVFNDGPEPTGLRYCNNGKVLTFKPDDGK